MGRKDATARGPPIDHYRKQIGKHDAKKDKSSMAKEMKKRGEMKNSAMSIQDILLLLGTILVLVVALYLYFFFYVYMEPNSNSDKPPPPSDVPS